MRISDWSSDVCSSDLDPWTGQLEQHLRGVESLPQGVDQAALRRAVFQELCRLDQYDLAAGIEADLRLLDEIRGSLLRILRADQIGRASCRERVCQYV